MCCDSDGHYEFIIFVLPRVAGSCVAQVNSCWFMSSSRKVKLTRVSKSLWNLHIIIHRIQDVFQQLSNGVFASK